MNIDQGNLTECLIFFGESHDARFKEYINSMIRSNCVGIMDRGTNTKFGVRIKHNMKMILDHNKYRVVWFCDLETKKKFK